MFRIILNPIKAIEKENKNRSTGKTISKSVVGSIFLGVAALLVMINLKSDFASAIQVAIAFMLLGFLGNFVNAWIYNLAIKTISGKGKYLDSLAGLSNMLLVIGTGMMFAAALMLIPQAGIILATLLLVIMFVLGYSVLIKSLTTFTGADLLTVVIGLGVVIFASLIASYLVIAITFTQTTLMQQGMMATI